MEIYTPEQLTKNMRLTPDGFLVCYGVPFARTGRMPYVEGEIVTDEGEVKLKGGPDGILWVDREPEVIFDPRAIASFEGKPATNDHPPIMLTPASAGKYSIGHMQNVRRGEAPFSDYLVCDLFITCPKSIGDIRSGKKQVSAGYDASYEQIVAGAARMVGLMGNHLALVKAGRCGPTCAIQDKGDNVMSKPSFMDKLKAAFTLGDQVAFDAALKDLPAGDLAGTTALAGGVHVHLNGATRDEGPAVSGDDIAPNWFKTGMKTVTDDIGALKEELKTMDARMTTMDAAIKSGRTRDDGETMDEDGDEDDKKTVTKDSADTLVLFRRTVSMAEILAPGVKLPTMDAAATVKTTKTALCKFRRAVVGVALTRPEAKEEITSLLAGRTFDGLPCSEVRVIFEAGAQILRSGNNKIVNGNAATRDNRGAYEPPSNAERNAKADEFWNKRAMQ